jgi:endonuclease YncB( thermonuclease family)
MTDSPDNKAGKPNSRRACRAIAALILLATATPANSQTQAITGKVVGVSGGDTLTVLDDQKRQHKIRLDGIYAPESSQDFGSKAKQSLSELVFGKTVIVLSSKKDRDGRIVGKVMLRDGRDINLEQIERGMAWFYRANARGLSREDAKAYEQAEQAAREEKIGLWAGPSPIPPWELRTAQRNESSGGNRRPSVTLEARPQSTIIGNRNLMIYHRPDCPDYDKVSERNRVLFKTEADAEAAGYRKARNCP